MSCLHKSRMRAIGIFILMVVYGADGFTQSKLQKLLVAEYRIDSSGSGKYTYLTAYKFKEGLFVSKDTLFEAPTTKEGIMGAYVVYGYYAGGENTIYKNRYVITTNGAVIDVRSGKLVREQSDHFVEAIGDTLIFTRNDSITGKRYLALDLKTGAYDFIKENTWYKPRFGNSSPDNNYYLTIDRSTFPYKVCLNGYDGNRKVVVSDAGEGFYNSLSSQLPDVETYWLNNHSFLYVVHHLKRSAQDKLYHKVDIRKYNLTDGSDDSFFTLDSIPQGVLNGYFYENGVGETLYVASSGQAYLLDTIHSRLLDYPEAKWGHHFTTRSDKDGLAFKYKDMEIGTIWAKGVFIDQGVISTEYGETGSNLGYPKGIKVWTAEKKEWVTFDIPWISAIVGWLNED